MTSPRAFYESRLGDRLMDSSCHPVEINEFLRRERRIVDSVGGEMDLLIEVGCMHGRYLGWAIDRKKLYIGIDFVARHIQAGRRLVDGYGLSAQEYQFIHGDAEDLTSLLDLQCPWVGRYRCLVLFPFNSFGNVMSAERVMAGLRQCKLPFIISSYQTTEYATACRYEYYRRCVHEELLVSSDASGVCFSSKGGLRTVAYHPAYLRRLCSTQGLTVKAISWAGINLIYVTDTLLRAIQLDDFTPKEARPLRQGTRLKTNRLEVREPQLEW